MRKYGMKLSKSVIKMETAQYLSMNLDPSCKKH